MFLSQVPHTPGLEVSVIVDLDRDRAREACRTVGWDAERIARTTFTDDGVARDRRRQRIGRRGGSHRQSRRRHQACPRRDCSGQACRHGQCRGRCAGRSAAGRGSAQGRRGLFAGLWRPAGADRRDGGLGARDGFSRRRRRQGHQIPAGLSRRDAGGRLGPLRTDGGRGAIGRHEPADVQFVSRRHQIRDRNGGDRQRLPGSTCPRTACCFRPAASTICRM